MRVIRVLIYEGNDAWVKATLERSLQGTHRFGLGSITAATVAVRDDDPQWRPWLGDTDECRCGHPLRAHEGHWACLDPGCHCLRFEQKEGEDVPGSDPS